MLKAIKLLFIFVCWTLSFSLSKTADAAKLSFLRDAEIENTIALMAKPVFEAAGIPADNVEIYLVNDSRLNAFVAGGQKLFIHTGLLQRARTPEQVIGVIAHETGHIAGGHLARIKQKLQGVPAESILGYVLGGAAILAGQPGAGTGLIIGGQEMATRSILNYTRMEEGSADQAALTYLDATHISSKGLLEFFNILKRDELYKTADQNPYIRSHPLTGDRITSIQAHVETSPYANKRVSNSLIERHNRMRAKLDAYLLPFEHTMRLYPVSDTSIWARYARAQAYHLDSRLDKALEEIDSLIAERPADPYFHELKGQIYFENGMSKEAISSYKKAVEILPNEPQILLSLGRSYVESNDPALLNEAIDILEKSAKKEKGSSFIWRQLGIAYGKAGKMAHSSLALAEEAYLLGRYKDAVFLAGRAENEFKTGSPEWIQAQDVRLTAERLLKKQQQ